MLIVAVLGLGLMAAAPAAPLQHQLGTRYFMPHQLPQQDPDLGHGQWNQLLLELPRGGLFFTCLGLAACARTTVR